VQPRARVIGVMNQKGGVGKTTTTVNLAASFAVLEQRVLVVDLDPQGAVSVCFGIKRPDLPGGMYDVVVHGRDMAPLAVTVGRVPLDVIAANIWSDEEEAAYTSAIRPAELVRELAQLRSRYDYILMDSPPTMGSIAVTAMAAADSLLIPVQCEELGLLAVGRSLQLMRKVRASINPRLMLEGVLVTMADGRTSLTAEVVNTLRRSFGDSVLRTLVPRSVDLARAISHGEPLLYYDVRSNGAQAYLNVAWELMQRTPQGEAA
jgi:chromosome partitioning protein